MTSTLAVADAGFPCHDVHMHALETISINVEIAVRPASTAAFTDISEVSAAIARARGLEIAYVCTLAGFFQSLKWIHMAALAVPLVLIEGQQDRSYMHE